MTFVKETRTGYDVLNHWYICEGEGLQKFNIFPADFAALQRAGYSLQKKESQNCNIPVTLKKPGKFWQIDTLILPDGSTADFDSLREKAKKIMAEAEAQKLRGGYAEGRPL